MKSWCRCSDKALPSSLIVWNATQLMTIKVVSGAYNTLWCHTLYHLLLLLLLNGDRHLLQPKAAAKSDLDPVLVLALKCDRWLCLLKIFA